MSGRRPLSSIRRVPGTRLAAALLALVVAAACQPPAAGDELSAKPAPGDEVRYLNSQSPSLASPVPADVASRRPKFVIVEIKNVVNPRRVPLGFTVAFRPAQGPDVPLGTFSLYPADHPGRFIVATQGRIQPGGQVVVTLNDVRPEGVGDVRVGVGAMTLGAR